MTINGRFAGKYVMFPGKIHTRFGRECGQSGHGRPFASMRSRHSVRPVHKIQ